MTEPIQTTAAEVVAGLHPEKTTVALTGVCGLSTFHKSMQGNPWASGRLNASPTSVEVYLFPTAYQEYEGILGPTADEYRPPTITITGKVTAGSWGPAVSIDHVERLSGPAKHGLDHFRTSDAKVRLVGLEVAAQHTLAAIEADKRVSVETVLAGLIKIGQALLPIVSDDGPLAHRIGSMADQKKAERLDDQREMFLIRLEDLVRSPGVAP